MPSRVNLRARMPSSCSSVRLNEESITSSDEEDSNDEWGRLSDIILPSGRKVFRNRRRSKNIKRRSSSEPDYTVKRCKVVIEKLTASGYQGNPSKLCPNVSIGPPVSKPSTAHLHTVGEGSDDTGRVISGQQDASSTLDNPPSISPVPVDSNATDISVLSSLAHDANDIFILSTLDPSSSTSAEFVAANSTVPSAVPPSPLLFPRNPPIISLGVLTDAPNPTVSGIGVAFPPPDKTSTPCTSPGISQGVSPPHATLGSLYEVKKVDNVQDVNSTDEENEKVCSNLKCALEKMEANRKFVKLRKENTLLHKLLALRDASSEDVCVTD